MRCQCSTGTGIPKRRSSSSENQPAFFCRTDVPVGFLRSPMMGCCNGWVHFGALIGRLRRVRGQTLSYPCLGHTHWRDRDMLGDPIFWIFVLPGLLLGAYAQSRIKINIAKYSQVGTQDGITGAQVARRLLDSQGLRNVAVESTPGMLSDHYDPRSKTLRLSQEVYFAPSVAAAGIAAHEAGQKSDSAIVAGKPTNKAGQPAAESVEPSAEGLSATKATSTVSFGGTSTVSAHCWCGTADPLRASIRKLWPCRCIGCHQALSLRILSR